MQFIAPLQVLFEHQEVGERDGKEIDLGFVGEMCLAVVRSNLETRRRLFQPSERLQGQTLVVNHVWWLVIVVHRIAGLADSAGSLLEGRGRIGLAAESLQRDALPVMDVVLLMARQLAFAEPVRPLFGLLKPTLDAARTGVPAIDFDANCVKHSVYWAGTLAFAAFPGMKPAGQKRIQRLLMTAENVQQCHVLQREIITRGDQRCVLRKSSETLLRRMAKSLG